MRAPAVPLILLLLVAGLAGCASDPEPASDDATVVPDEPTRKHVVLAVIDTGVNPYHAEFQELYDDRDPAGYIPGYPADVEVLRLSAWDGDASGPNRARADADVWQETRPGVLYRYEGTKIVGHISFGGDLPGSGHGTMTASRATGDTISVGGPDVRLVMVQGFTVEAIDWVAEQDWIDMASISSGISLGGVAPGAANAENQAGIEAFQRLAHRKPFFASSGNGVGNAGVLGFPTWLRGPSGAPDVISVGANENGDMAVWHNWQPYIVGDGCGNPSAQDGTADEVRDTGGGTSSATPFSAGTGAALLLEARRLLDDAHVGVRWSEEAVPSWRGWDSLSEADARIVLARGEAGLVSDGPLADGVLTAQEFKDVLYHTALPDGTEDASDGAEACQTTARAVGDDGTVPMEGRAFFQGYGEVNAASLERGVAVLGGGPLPERPVEDAAYADAHLLRQQTYLG